MVRTSFGLGLGLDEEPGPRLDAMGVLSVVEEQPGGARVGMHHYTW